MSIRMRHTKSHSKNRRSHHALSGMKAVVDKGTGKLTLPHRLDESTGMYRGKQIVTAKEKKAKVEKVKARKEHSHDHSHEAKESGSKGFLGRLMNSRPKARSGAGGGGA